MNATLSAGYDIMTSLLEIWIKQQEQVITSHEKLSPDYKEGFHDAMNHVAQWVVKNSAHMSAEKFAGGVQEGVYDLSLGRGIAYCAGAAKALTDFLLMMGQLPNNDFADAAPRGIDKPT